MASPAPRLPYLTDRPQLGPKAASSGLIGLPGSPNSPRTPLLGRSISSQFGSPSAYRSEQEEVVVYELGARHLSAGFAGESRPRCIYDFSPDRARRLGDYRACDANHRQKRRRLSDGDSWSEEYELYRTDVRSLDLRLVEDRLERAIRSIHVDHLQMDQKARKAILVIPPLLPTPVVEVALKTIFNHSTQFTAVTLVTSPFLACVGAGLRSGLVVDVGWEEAVVTAVGEYKQVFQRRSVRAGRLLVREMAKLLHQERAQGETLKAVGEVDDVSFQHAEDVTKRLGWCRPRVQLHAERGIIKIPLDHVDGKTPRHINVPFQHLSNPAEVAFFPYSQQAMGDDHDLPIVQLMYSVLLALPLDLRAICISRIIVTGGASALPGFKQRLLEELSHTIKTRGWNPVHSYGSATQHHQRTLMERSANIAKNRQQKAADPPLSPTKKPIQEDVPHMERIHDDKYDDLTQKVEREAKKGKTEDFKGAVRGASTLGAWAGASLIASLRVKGSHEIEREEFLKHGLRDGGTPI